MLERYNRKESIPSLIKHILEESEKNWGINDINGYIQKLVQIVIRNRLHLIGKFETLNGEKWQDIVRNISIFGEELDLGNLRPMKDDWYFKNPHNIIRHYEDELLNIFIGINRMIESIEENSDYRINHEELADIIFETIISWFREHISEFEENYKKYSWNKWEKDFEMFLDWFFRSCFTYFTNYIHISGFATILKEKFKR